MIITHEPATAHTLHTDNDLIVRLAESQSADALFDEICAQFDNKKIEQDAQGNVYVIAPAGGESSDQNCELSAELGSWSNRDNRGRSFASSVLFIFPDGSKRCPDASWVSYQRLKTLTREERRQFLKLVPEFVAEIKSPSDNYSELQAKMEDYRKNGVTLGWLIHPDKRTVAIYRQGSTEVEVIERPETLAADEPLSGFVLNLKPIWEGLDF